MEHQDVLDRFEEVNVTDLFGTKKSVSHKKGLMFGTLTVHHGSDSMVIKQINKARDFDNNSIKQRETISSADEIKKFKELLDEGVLTQEEFDAKKKELLGL